MKEAPENWLADFYLCSVGFNLQVDGVVILRVGGCMVDWQCCAAIGVAPRLSHRCDPGVGNRSPTQLPLGAGGDA